MELSGLQKLVIVCVSVIILSIFAVFSLILIIPSVFLLLYLMCDISRNCKFIQNNTGKKTSSPYVAVILPNKYFPSKFNHFLYGLDNYFVNVKKLIEYFKRKKIKYKIYTNGEEIKKEIRNPNIYSIILIGHGIRHGIALSKDEILYYCELRGISPKRVIAQFHCNHFKGNPLTRYVKCKTGDRFVTNNKLRATSVNKMIDKIIDENLLDPKTKIRKSFGSSGP